MDVDLTANSASSSISQPDMNDPGKAHYAQAIRQYQQYQTDWNAHDLDSAIHTGQLAIQATPEDLPDRAARCSDLGAMFAQRYELMEDLEDLDEAIRLATSAVSSLPASDPHRPAFSNNLGSYFRMRYDGTGELSDLNEALSITQRAIDSAPDTDPHLPTYLDNLATQLGLRSELEHSEASKEDAQRAVQLGQLVLQLVVDDNDNLPIYLGNLGNNFHNLYEQDDEVEYLNESIKWTRLAITLIPEGHPMWLPSKNNLGIGLERRYDLKGRREDLDEAIQIAREVVDSTEEKNPKLPLFLNTLGVKMASLYDHNGHVQDLEEAVRLTRGALDAASEDHRDRADWLNSLGTQLESLFRRTGELQYIEESVQAAQQAVELTPTNSPDRAAYLINLSNSLEARFEGTGDVHDLDKAINSAELSVNATGESDSRLSAYVTGLGTKFRHRYEITGDMTDLEEAVRFARRAVKMTPEDHRIYPSYLNSLGNALQSQYQRTGAIEHLSEAIELSQKAVSLTEPSHHDYPAWQINLANNLSLRFDHKGDMNDLEESVRLARQTVELTKGDHLDRDPSMNNLAGMLCKRYNHNKNVKDLEESIQLTQRALGSTSEGNPNWSSYMRNLGIRLAYRYERNSDTSDRDSALQYFVRLSQALQATPLSRVEASRAAIRILKLKDDWEQASNLAAEALKLLPLVCSRYLGLRDQQYALTQTSGLAADACSLALKTKDVEAAIQQLEFGRGMIVGYMIDSRSDLSELKKDYRELAEQYETLRYKASRKIDSQEASVRDGLLKDRREAVQQIEGCIQRIRKETRHKGFLLGPTIEELKRAATAGPIAVVNVTDISADSLIVSPKEIKAVQLPGLLNERAPPLVQQELRWYKNSSRGDYNRDMESEAESQLGSDHLSWLWTNCVKLILEELDKCSTPMPNALPHVWWIGTGIASSFPFHAAGAAFEDSTDNTLSHIVPSYAPSIKALIHSKSQSLRQSEKGEKIRSVLVVTMSKTPGQRPLPGVDDEEKVIENVCKNAYSVEPLPHPTAEDVLRKLPVSEVVHFACHASSNPTDPSNSHILLQKPGETGLTVDRLSLSQIANVVTQGQAQIAFLSACSTAEVKASKLADEGLHLASAFQVAGFAHVIGALWSANDDVCVRVAEIFYTNLVKADQATYSDGFVASALREAVLQVRSEYPGSPKLWAPFIHLGA